MIRILDISQYTTITDVKAMLTQQQSVEVVIPRIFDGFRDDQKWRSHIMTLMGQLSRNGEVLLAPYQYLNHSESAPEGDDQVVDAWSTLNSGGRIATGPVCLDVEKTSKSPFPTRPQDYLDKFLIPAISQVIKLDNRHPIIYWNADALLNYFVYIEPVTGRKLSLFTKPEYAVVKNCPLWLADWSKEGEPVYWPKIAELGVWENWTIHQHAGSVKDWPGAYNVDLNRGAGDRGMWKAYFQKTGPVPTEGTTPPPPPPPPPPPTGDLTAEQHVDAAIAIASQEPATREKAVAKTDLEKVKAWIKTYW